MASKAAAALARIREIDKKYKSKQEKRYSVFSESSISIDTEKPQKLLKPQLNIKMPDPYEEYMNINTSSESKKCSVPVKIIYELPKQSSNSNDSSKRNNNLEEQKTMSDKITTNNENISENNETNESISEILEDTQSLSQISTKSQKFIDEKYCKNSSLNLLTMNETSESDKKIRTEEDVEEEVEEEEHEEINEKENVDLEKKNFLVHYSDESFESSSSETDDSQLRAASEQLQSKINHEKVSIKKSIIFSNNETSISDDTVSDYLDVSHDKVQESDENLNTTSKNFNFSNMSNDSTSDKKSSSGSKNKNKKIDAKDDGNQMVKTMRQTSCESEITNKYSNKQLIKSSESTSQVLVIFNQKPNKKMSKESDDTIETIKSSRQISSLLLTSSESSEIVKPKNPEKINRHHKRKYIYDKPNEKYCSSAMINYVRKIREEQQKLHLLPTQMICSDKIKIQSIKPLEFPKILNFVQNNKYKNPDFNLEILQNHLSNIRQWLKEQYLIYRENCDVAVHINSNYHPTTLYETKKIIYQLQSKARAKNKNQ